VAGDGLPDDIYVGRQAIFDSRRRVMGYELLYRRSADNWAPVEDAVEATSAVVSAALLGFGLDHLVSDGLAFVNVSREFLACGLHRVLPAERVVLEVLEHEVVDDALVDLLGAVRAEGYRLALDDYVSGSAARRLVGLAEIVKIDLMATPRAGLSDLVTDLRSQGAVILAEKVETPDDLQTVRAIGIEFLQGFFFQRPEVLSGRTVSIGQLPAVRLLASVERPDVSIAEMEAIIACEPGLAYRLLRLANSSSVAVPRPVTSLRDALVLLGRRTIKNLALVAMIHGVEGKTSELATTAMVRAKMCEQLAAQVAPASAPAAFLVGLLSVLDAVFDAPISGLVDQLSLSDEIASALVDHRGPLGEVLEVAIEYERGERRSPHTFALTSEATLDAYATAVPWADRTMAELAGPDDRARVATRPYGPSGALTGRPS
jgi:EAL and modified HD-GYP domain-containing signal transduction protein